MLVIDEHVDIELITALKLLKAEPGAARCIYLHLMDTVLPEAIGDVAMESAKQHITAEDMQIYFLEDGDICVIASVLPSRQAHLFMLDVAGILQRSVDKSWVSFYEAGTPQINQIIAILDAKLEKRRKIEAAKQAQAEEHLRAAKRQAILGGAVQGKAADIEQRRANRQRPELMMIEDDVFSRRLVETVLKKQYPLTAIGEATHALETYERLAPDVLFLDINLPDVTGHELLERIIQLDPKAYIVMFSGNADHANIAAAMSKGAKGFIAKPFTSEKLFQYLQRCPTIKQV